MDKWYTKARSIIKTRFLDGLRKGLIMRQRKLIKKIIICMFILWAVFTTGVFAKSEPVVNRIEGKSRIETSIAVSKEAFKDTDKPKTAIIVGYHGEVDALTGTILAEKKKAPILIGGKDKLDDNIKKELKRLGTKEVFILGGEKAVNKTIEQELKNLSLEVIRIDGATRADTAIKIAKEAVDGDVSEVFLCLGYETYADALAIGPVAARKNTPVLLTRSKKISKETLQYIEKSNIQSVNIIGGEKAVGKEIENVLKNKKISTRRIEGPSRADTAIEIAKQYVKNYDKIFIANGYKYVDAVIGGYLAAKENIPILLTHGSKLHKSNSEYIKENALDVSILGGSSTIKDPVLKDIKISLGLIEEPIIGIRPTIEIEREDPKNIDELRQLIYRELNTLKTKIEVEYDYEISSDQIGVIVDGFWNSGSYVAGNTQRIGHVLRTSSRSPISTITVQVEHLTTSKQEDFIDQEVAKIIRKIIKPKMSQLEKVKAIHDYIINNTVYSDKTKTTAHSAYTLLKEGKGVCQAYALTTYKFLDAVGIENYYVIGSARGGHAWNKVKVDGKWYNMDVTWDDPLTSTGENILRYDFFLISDKKLNETHTPKSNDFPKATDTRYEGRKW